MEIKKSKSDLFYKGEINSRNKKITKSIIKFVEESSFQLQESLAEGIAKLVKDQYKSSSIKLRISKPGALRHAEDVGVIIHR